MTKPVARTSSYQSDTAQADGSVADTARLAAELAAERHVTLELQRAILPLHEGPFDLPGLRALAGHHGGYLDQAGGPPG